MHDAVHCCECSIKKIDSSRGSTALHCTPISILCHGTFSTFVLQLHPNPMSLLVAPSFHLVTQLDFKLCFSFFRYCLISNSFHQCILQVMLSSKPKTKPIPSNISNIISQEQPLQKLEFMMQHYILYNRLA